MPFDMPVSRYTQIFNKIFYILYKGNNYWQTLKLKDPRTDSLATSARRAPRIAAALLC